MEMQSQSAREKSPERAFTSNWKGSMLSITSYSNSNLAKCGAQKVHLLPIQTIDKFQRRQKKDWRMQIGQ